MLTAKTNRLRRTTSVSIPNPSGDKSLRRSRSFFDNKSYSFAHAQQKIEYLAQFGYVFTGNLPTYQEIPTIQRSPLCRYLFMRNGKYYQFRGNDFLDGSFTVTLDAHHEPLQTLSFSRIKEGDFIHFMVRERSSQVRQERLVLLLKPDATLSGHSMIAGPYGKIDPEFEVIGGEVYFYAEEILLVNHKSGNFHTSAQTAAPMVSAILGEPGLRAFYPAVEREDVDGELERRKHDFDAARGERTPGTATGLMEKLDRDELQDSSALHSPEDLIKAHFEEERPNRVALTTPAPSCSAPRPRKLSWFKTNNEEIHFKDEVIDHPRPQAPSPNEEEQSMIYSK
jgi:hypothetical protein